MNDEFNQLKSHFRAIMALIYGIWSWRKGHLDRHRKANLYRLGEA